MISHLQTIVPMLGLLAAFALIALNAFFVAAEFAIVKVRRTRLEELAGQGNQSAKISLGCVNRLDEYLSVTQLGITLASLALGWIGEAAFAELFYAFFPGLIAQHPTLHLVTFGVSFLLVTMLHVVLGELIPKSIAIQDAERVTLLIARPLHWFFRVSRPVVRAFTWIANRLLHRIGYFGFEEPPLTEKELMLVMKESREDGVISDSEAQIISRAFEFSDKHASDILVPRERVNYISLSRPFQENLDAVRTKMHTRFPVCQTDLDSVIGTVHMKDVWPKIDAASGNEIFQDNCRAPIFVEAGLRQDQIMKLFQGCRAHLAIVRDSHSGKNIGIVTLEDVLENLVGEIRDEHGN